MPRRATSAAARVPSPRTIAMWPVARLIPYDKNPRKHSEAQVASIAASITAFGFNNPILVDAERGIVAGHGRLSAAKLLGLREVPVIELTHMTAAQRRAYIIADNKLAALAGWDEVKLAAELRALEADGFDLELTGFSDDDLQRLQDDLDARALQVIVSAAAAPDTSSPAPSSSSSGASEEQDAAAPSTPALPAGTESQREELAQFSVHMSADDRARLFEAISAAKRKWSLTTSDQALLAIANDFLGRQR